MTTPTTNIPGIGPATAQALAASGFSSVEKIASSDVASLATVPGFGPTRAANVIEAALAIATAPQAKPEKKKKKKKKKSATPAADSKKKVKKKKAMPAKKDKKGGKKKGKKDKGSKKSSKRKKKK